MKGPKTVWYQKRKKKYSSCRYNKSKQEASNIGIGKMDAHYS